MENLSYEIKFDLYENEPVGGIHFHMNRFALKLGSDTDKATQNAYFKRKTTCQVVNRAVRI